MSSKTLVVFYNDEATFLSSVTSALSIYLATFAKLSTWQDSPRTRWYYDQRKYQLMQCLFNLEMSKLNLCFSV